MLLWISLALADLPAVSDGVVQDRHCVDGRCVAWWEGPSMGGCAGACCHEHGIWIGPPSDGEGRIVAMGAPGASELSGRSSLPHPVSVRWVGPRQVEVVRRVALLPADDATLAPWRLGEFRGWGLVADRYDLRDDSLNWVSSDWVREGDRKVAQAIQQWLPAPAERGTPPDAAPIEPAVRALIDKECTEPHDVVWVHARDHEMRLLMLGTHELESAPTIGCVVMVHQDGPMVDRWNGAGQLFRSEAMACAAGGVEGARGLRGGIHCYGLKRLGPTAFDLTGWVVSGVEAYPLIYQEDAQSVEGVLDHALTVELLAADQIVHGRPRWSGPEDLSARWRAARIDDELVLHVQVTDDQVQDGLSPLADHLEVDIWRHVEAPQGEAPVRLAVVHQGDETQVRRWRWGGEETDEPSPGNASWSVVDGGYEVVLRLPEAAGLPSASDYALAVRVSDGDGGRQVILGDAAWVTWDNRDLTPLP